MYLLGVDIGSYSAKGVLLSQAGEIVATATQAHEMKVPGPGLAEHDADQDWWGGFCSVTRQLLAQTGIDPKQIASVGCSGIGPCMLPVDATGKALRAAVLYGIDTRAKDEIIELTQRYGADFIMDHCGMSLTTQAVGPKMLWLARSGLVGWFLLCHSPVAGANGHRSQTNRQRGLQWHWPLHAARRCHGQGFAGRCFVWH